MTWCGTSVKRLDRRNCNLQVVAPDLSHLDPRASKAKVKTGPAKGVMIDRLKLRVESKSDLFMTWPNQN